MKNNQRFVAAAVVVIFAMVVLSGLVAATGAPFTVSLTPSSASPSAGDALTLSAAVSGGIGPYALTWTGSTEGTLTSTAAPADCLAAESTAGTYNCTITAPSAGPDAYTIGVTDADAQYASNTAAVEVFAPASTNLSCPPFTVGQSTTCTATITGAAGEPAPTGNVLFTAYSPTGSFSPATCPQLFAIGPYTSSCSVSYSATSINDEGKVALAFYSGDSYYASGSMSMAVEPIVNPIPTISVTPQYHQIDKGQTDIITAVGAGGTGPLTYSWTVPFGLTVSSGCASSDTTCTVIGATSSASTYSVTVQVTDTNLDTSNIAIAPVTVNPALTLTVSATPSVIDSGDSTTLSAAASGGSSGTYTYTWYQTTCTGTPLRSGPSSITVQPTAQQTTAEITYCVSATDLINKITGTNTVTINPALSASLSATPSAIDVSQPTTLTANAIGGSGTYSYAFTDMNGNQLCKVAPTSSPTATCANTPIASGTYTVSIADGIDAATGTSPVTVNALPTIMLSASTPTAIEAGQSVTFTNATTLGTPPYLFSYTTNAPDALVTGNSILFPTAGAYNVVENVQDITGANVPSTATVVTVSPAPAITLTPSTTLIILGGSVTFTNSTAGGIGPYTFNYLLPGNSGITQSGNTFTFPNLGVYDVAESVTDNSGVMANSPAVAITVYSPNANLGGGGAFGGTSAGVIGGGIPSPAVIAPAVVAPSPSSTTIPMIKPQPLAPSNSVSTTTTIPSTTTTALAATTTISLAAQKGPSNGGLWILLGIAIVIILIALSLYLLSYKKKPAGKKKGGKQG